MITQQEYLNAKILILEYEKTVKTNNAENQTVFSRRDVKLLLRQLSYNCMTSYAYFKGYNKKRRIISDVNNIIGDSPKHYYFKYH